MLGQTRISGYSRQAPSVAANYYAVCDNDPELENAVVRLIQADVIPETHVKLASIVKKLQTFTRARGRRALKQLIVELLQA